jgi:phospholipid/cholesterol/gamma-HCH transport system substrate-binding protein
MSMVGRVAAIAAVLVAVVGLAVLLLGSGSGSFKIKARFINASQVVKGDLVQVSGDPVGKVTDIQLTPDGQAELSLEIDHAYAPLRRGTQLTVRQASLSGIANRYVDLRLPPGKPTAWDEKSVIPATDTTTAVDLDQLFNVFGPRERKGLQDVLQGSALQYQGQGERSQAGWEYLNPALASSSVLFRELNRDTKQFTKFLVGTAHLVTDVAQRREDLAGLVDHLATTTGAIARPSGALADAIGQLPPFMRRANTTFVDLRTTLDALRPLVAESKPVAKKLRPFLAQLRPLAVGAQPTIRDLSRLTSSPGANNDLIELTAGAVPLAKITVGHVFANGKLREGAFTASTKALKTSIPELAYARPYAVDLTGWFDDFSHTGVVDALGGVSRVSPVFDLQSPQVNPVPGKVQFPGLGVPNTFVHQFERCPGSEERGSLYVPAAHLAPPYSNVPYCQPSQVPPGP